ncbi:hydrogenase formation protein HypD [Vibrio sp. HA2012]|uniref:hydrogenase formation protein HypD n=1 Tax=Vibrio sp. HA2012 TaxID=1971595 RepID=UPI000C2BEAA9|nr:hydrogenase formation protein HypD [Vibrio sp. HA2012]PJC87732.1 hydrogenase formation protein HypD [Vibrio sp. HA2012]
MKYVDEFRNPGIVNGLVAALSRLLSALPEQQKPLQIMEVCGGHTHTLFKYGILQLLPDDIEFIHGPGCPVCVLPTLRLDQCMAVARQSDTILCTFGDAMRVPGSDGSLLDARAKGCDIRIVYSPLDALALAEKYPDKQIVFFALGFETTMPATAMTVLQAHKKKIRNFKIFCQHITIMPVLTTLLEQEKIRIDGFLLPGHLSVITGTRPYQPLADRFHKPCVVSGFEPLDMLHALLMLVTQIKEKRCAIENQYRRVVTTEGNLYAQRAMSDVFTTKEESEWRGLGAIPGSGIRLRDAYRNFDAEAFPVPEITSPQAEKTKSGLCNNVLTGRCKPTDCPLFGQQCTPETAIGALMVSSEGACAAYYQYTPPSPQTQPPPGSDMHYPEEI